MEQTDRVDFNELAASYILSILADMYKSTGRSVEQLMEDVKDVAGSIEIKEIKTPHGTLKILENKDLRSDRRS